MERVDINGEVIKPGCIIVDGRTDRRNSSRKLLFEVKYIDQDVLVSYPLNDFSANGPYKTVTWFHPQNILIVGYMANGKVALRGSYLKEVEELGIDLEVKPFLVKII